MPPAHESSNDPQPVAPVRDEGLNRAANMIYADFAPFVSSASDQALVLRVADFLAREARR